MKAMWELREGLRKRGESWHKWPDEDSTTWQAYSNPHTATESMDGTLIVTGLTPAQAVAATLGSGTCSIVERYMDWYCTGCGEMVGTCDVTHELHIDGNAIKLWRYCPQCGRKVVTS